MGKASKERKKWLHLHHLRSISRHSSDDDLASLPGLRLSSGAPRGMDAIIITHTEQPERGREGQLDDTVTVHA